MHSVEHLPPRSKQQPVVDTKEPRTYCKAQGLAARVSALNRASGAQVQQVLPSPTPGVLGPSIDAILRNPSNAAVQHKSWRQLETLTKDAPVTKVAKLQSLVGSTLSHTDTDLKDISCAVLAQLATHDANKAIIASTPGMMCFLAEAIRKIPLSAGVQRLACILLHHPLEDGRTLAMRIIDRDSFRDVRTLCHLDPKIHQACTPLGESLANFAMRQWAPRSLRAFLNFGMFPSSPLAKRIEFDVEKVPEEIYDVPSSRAIRRAIDLVLCTTVEGGENFKALVVEIVEKYIVVGNKTFFTGGQIQLKHVDISTATLICAFVLMERFMRIRPVPQVMNGMEPKLRVSMLFAAIFAMASKTLNDQDQFAPDILAGPLGLACGKNGFATSETRRLFAQAEQELLRAFSRPLSPVVTHDQYEDMCQRLCAATLDVAQHAEFQPAAPDRQREQFREILG